MEEGEKLVCHNCGREYRVEDHSEHARRDRSARDRVLQLCPECLIVSRM